MGSFTILGLIVALMSPKVYTSTVVLAPEMSNSSGLSTGLSGIASNFGIDIADKAGADAIYPEIYPDVLSSNEFVVDLFNVPVERKGKAGEIAYLAHLTQDTKIGLWDYPKVWISRLLLKKEDSALPVKNGGEGKIDPTRLSKIQQGVCDNVKDAISCQVDNKTSVIVIGVKDQDPLTAAIMADTVQRRLQEYITQYRTKKARHDLAYYEQLCRNSRVEYIKAQQRYAAYADANNDVVLESVRAKQEEMENEMQLKFNSYNMLVTQVQQAKAKVLEQTPAFTVVQRAAIPYRASSTPRLYILLIYIFLGFMAAVAWVNFIKNNN